MPYPRGLIVLEEDFIPNRQYTEEELKSYALINLGVSSIYYKEFAEYVGRAINTPLPSHWLPCMTPTGEIVYYNLQNQYMSRFHPIDMYYKFLYKFVVAGKKKHMNVSYEYWEQLKGYENELEINERGRIIGDTGNNSKDEKKLSKLTVKLEKAAKESGDLKDVFDKYINSRAKVEKYNLFHEEVYANLNVIKSKLLKIEKKEEEERKRRIKEIAHRKDEIKALKAKTEENEEKIKKVQQKRNDMLEIITKKASIKKQAETIADEIAEIIKEFGKPNEEIENEKLRLKEIMEEKNKNIAELEEIDKGVSESARELEKRVKNEELQTSKFEQKLREIKGSIQIFMRGPGFTSNGKRLAYYDNENEREIEFEADYHTKDWYSNELEVLLTSMTGEATNGYNVCAFIFSPVKRLYDSRLADLMLKQIFINVSSDPTTDFSFFLSIVSVKPGSNLMDNPNAISDLLDPKNPNTIKPMKDVNGVVFFEGAQISRPSSFVDLNNKVSDSIKQFDSKEDVLIISFIVVAKNHSVVRTGRIALIFAGTTNENALKDIDILADAFRFNQFVIPYNSTALTLSLSDVLGGNAKTFCVGSLPDSGDPKEVKRVIDLYEKLRFISNSSSASIDTVRCHALMRNELERGRAIATGLAREIENRVQRKYEDE